MTDCPFHKMLRHLKTFAGLPVPDSAKIVDGKPDFRQIDTDKMMHHFRFRLCAVCGRKLSLSCYWIGGPLSSHSSHLYTDFAMHKECAEESARLCPFLNGTRQHYRGDLPTVPEHDTDGRPERMFIMRGATANITVRQLPSGEAAYHAGDVLWPHKEF